MKLFTTISCFAALGSQPQVLETPQEDAKAKVQYRRWMDFYEQEAKKIRIFFDNKEKTELKFEPTVVLKWTNPTRANEIHDEIGKGN